MLLSALEKLKRFYAQFSADDNVLVLINADPDSIASAMAVKRLLWRRVAGVTISNINIIKRPDNLAMIRLLGVNMIHVGEIDANKFSRFVITDSQPDHNNLFLKYKYNVILDHHPETNAEAGY
ncbi:MAG: phosphoesterase, partial [Proteobacteria bacterium]|nr:phosphoesterase [Pseudomonadota bacterium]